MPRRHAPAALIRRFLLRLPLWLAAVSILSAPLPARTGVGSYVVRMWHVDDGLPSENVTALLQDRRGYLWVATSSGIARFDGSHFQRYTPSMTVQPFIYVAERLDGSLLLVPRAGAPLIMRGHEFTAQPLPAPYTEAVITAAFLESDETCWYGLRNGPVLRVGPTGVEVFSEKDGISSRRVPHFARDSQNQVWVVSDAFLGRYESGHLAPIDAGTNGAELRIASSRTSGPWLITPDRVLKNRINGFETIAHLPPLLGAHYVATASEDHHGNLWLGTRSQGVHCVTANGLFSVPTTHDDIYALTEDSDGNLWVGTNSGGLNAIAPKIFEIYDRKSGLLQNVTGALCEDRSGDMWFANGDGGIARLSGGKLEIVPAQDPDSGRFAAVSVAPHPDGGAWLCGAPGLFRVTDGHPGTLMRVPSLSGRGIRRVSLTARNGDLWLSLDPSGIGRLRDGILTAFGAAEGFTGREIRALAEDQHGLIWAGTSDGLLFQQNGERFAAVPIPTSAPVGAINAIYFEREGEVWLGTSGAGIVVCTGQRAHTLTAAAGLPGNNVTHLVADDRGYVWCGSSQGLYRVSRSEVRRWLEGRSSTLNPLRLGPDEGFPVLNCSALYGPGATKSRDGTIWFGTRQGVVAIDPAAAALERKPPLVAIESYRCDDMEKPVTSPMQIDPTTRKLQIRYSALALTSPSATRIWYRLDGFDTGWVEGDASHVATYPRLPAGTYHFTVRAGPEETVRHEHTATILFTVPPLWWNTLWFRALVLGTLGSVIAVSVRVWSHRRLQRQVRQLEHERAIDRERARIAQNIHDDVGASLTRISLLTQTVAPQSPAHSENLERIYETTREITRSLDEIVWAVNPQYDTLESFAGYLADFAKQFLSLAQIRCRLDIPADLPVMPLTSQVRHDLFLCSREILNNVVKHAHASEVTLRILHSTEAVSIEVADNGRGLADARADSSADRVASGNGLTNIRQRISRLGGTCTIRSEPGHGTSIILSLPRAANGAATT